MITAAEYRVLFYLQSSLWNFSLLGNEQSLSQPLFGSLWLQRRLGNEFLLFTGVSRRNPPPLPSPLFPAFLFLKSSSPSTKKIQVKPHAGQTFPHCGSLYKFLQHEADQEYCYSPWMGSPFHPKLTHYVSLVPSRSLSLSSEREVHVRTWKRVCVHSVTL